MHRTLRKATVAGSLAVLVTGIAAPTSVWAASRYADVPVGTDVAAAVGFLADNGITLGCSPADTTRFCPDETVTRRQMALFLHRLAGKGGATPSVDAATVQGLTAAQLRGATGLTGPVGAKGDKGDTGAQGAKGDTGAQGEKGDTGARGEQGLQGLMGVQGLVGPQGDQGDRGETGATGARGEDGAQGADGANGAAGAAGPQGPKGEDGAAGPQGPKGEDGAAGPQGEDGAAGRDGVASTLYRQTAGSTSLPDGAARTVVTRTVPEGTYAVTAKLVVTRVANAPSVTCTLGDDTTTVMLSNNNPSTTVPLVAVVSVPQGGGPVAVSCTSTGQASTASQVSLNAVSVLASAS